MKKWSISYFFKLNTVSSSDFHVFQSYQSRKTPINKYNVYSWQALSGGWGVYFGSTNLDSENTAVIQPNPSISQPPTGTWFNYTITGDEDKWNLWINGVHNNQVDSLADFHLAHDFFIGNNYQKTYSLRGYLNNFGLWNRVLDEEEIKELYNEGRGLNR